MASDAKPLSYGSVRFRAGSRAEEVVMIAEYLDRAICAQEGGAFARDDAIARTPNRGEVGREGGSCIEGAQEE